MAKVVVLGAGISGHTAALFLRKHLKRGQHEVIVVSPNSNWNWIPSNIWVGVGLMQPTDVTFPLAPVYRRMGIRFHQARATAIEPEGNSAGDRPAVRIACTDEEHSGQTERIEYDYLINATGPRLNFNATPGLGPEGHSLSVCTPGHAVQANEHFEQCVQRMRAGRHQTFVIGTGHGTCTCQGAAFEYTFNLEFELRQRGVRDKARIIWLSNEFTLGDFGMGGLHLKRGGYITHSRIFTESLYAERGIEWILQAHVNRVEADVIHYEKLDGGSGELHYDFAMLLPPFTGVPMQAFDRNGREITDRLFQPNHMMKVDADYSGKSFENWKASDWPSVYQNPDYKNIFAVGIAFAPPHPVSKPMKSVKGVPISPTPPRTGMPSAMMGKAVALNIVDMIKGRAQSPKRTASMARMGAACVASAGNSLIRGTAAAMTVFPIIPDYERYPLYGRDTNLTFGEIGLAAHWIKRILHSMFIYKAKARPGWSLIPE
ncbi:MAG: FAD-dependent oxidoreductase [Leptospiraceae bacterium]|nr:FAD-dependent oxidoreductase [Leptospiraceae bacterium]